MSSGLDLVNEVISKRYHPSAWNIYCFQCSDGDNWPQDTQKTLLAVDRIKSAAQFFGYAEIELSDRGQSNWFDEAKLSNVYSPKLDKGFKSSTIKCKEDIWPTFIKFFGGRSE